MTMERATILASLALAEKQIGEGERQLRLQRELIAELQRSGRDATAAEALLKSSEQNQRLHFADRSRLLRELCERNGERYAGAGLF
jgi:hypothetical protein